MLRDHSATWSDNNYIRFIPHYLPDGRCSLITITISSINKTGSGGFTNEHSYSQKRKYDTTPQEIAACMDLFFFKAT